MAPADSLIIWLEAASPKFSPEAWKPNPQRVAERLGRLCFSPPGPQSPNYWRHIRVRGPADLAGPARIAAVVLYSVFGVTDGAVSDTWLNLPSGDHWADPTGWADALANDYSTGLDW